MQDVLDIFTPYTQHESAVEWLRRHLGGETAIDRKTMYHLNIVNSFIQNGKEIYKRLPSERIGGLPEGGRRNVAASVILRAKESPDSKESRNIRPSGYTGEQELIGNWAEKDGCWEDYAEGSLRRKGLSFAISGSEAHVFIDDGDRVFKTVDLSHYQTLEKTLDRISLHNAVFPETAMRVEGFGMRDDAEDASGFVIIVSQPFAEGSPAVGPDAPEKVFKEMQRRDFDLVRPTATEEERREATARGKEPPQYASMFWCLSDKTNSILLYDLHDQNLVFDEHGNMLVFDCEIKFNDSPRFGGPYQIPPVTFDETAVQQIDTLINDLVPKTYKLGSFLEMYGTEENGLEEQLSVTGRYNGLIDGAFDRWLVSLNPENKDEVLLLPQESAALMLSLLPEEEFSPAERNAIAAGLGVRKEGRFVAFNLDKGRVDQAREMKLKQSINISKPRPRPELAAKKKDQGRNRKMHP